MFDSRSVGKTSQQFRGLYEFDRNKWINDEETGDDSEADNESIDKNYSNDLTNNSVNDCKCCECCDFELRIH